MLANKNTVYCLLVLSALTHVYKCNDFNVLVNVEIN